MLMQIHRIRAAGIITPSTGSSRLGAGCIHVLLEMACLWKVHHGRFILVLAIVKEKETSDM